MPRAPIPISPRRFVGDAAPFSSLDSIAGWAAGLGYRGLRIPPFIDRHIIRVTDHAFDDFAAGSANRALNRQFMGIGQENR